ncbi:type VI secretion system membrane subunit TssM [Pseudomonas putida]|uniref:type VI secretion system membrane subunit TssM n=1 Tax=Pseudomonas putida TaxID=303 RepID=UPI00105994FC|nr:type VI secretion system membrane subunit TssM [Pseudomonas putida]
MRYLSSYFNFKREQRSWLKHIAAAMPLLLGLGLALLLVLIWWFGPQWTWRTQQPLASAAQRSIATLLLLMLPLLCWLMVLRSRFRRLRDERAQADAIVAEPSLVFLQEQQQALDQQLASYLKHAGGQRALYRLPCYLVLGAEGAGKSRLIEGTQQQFSLTHIGKAQALGLHGDVPVYGVDGWISDHAVIFDPPGGFITQGCAGINRHCVSDNYKPTLPMGTQANLWTHLLDWLVRNRGRRALNGLVLVVDLAALLHSSPEERTTLAHLVRARLHEVSSKLGLRLPLYVVFSKLDLLDGFDEFVSQLRDAQREQLLGFSFKLNVTAASDTWLSELDTQFDQLLKDLDNVTMSAFVAPFSDKQRKRLLTFQAQLAGLHPALVKFLTKALASDRFTTPALVRGLYWSSVAQHGIVENAFLRESAQPYVVPRPLREGKRNERPQSYFVKQLFRDVILPEAGLGSENIKVSHSKRRGFWLGCSCGLLAFVVVGSAFQYFFLVNREKANTVLMKSQAFKAAAVDQRLDPTGRNLLTSLQQVGDAASLFGDYRSAWSGFSDAGLYQGRSIGPLVDEAYLTLLSRRFLPALASGLVDAMNAAPVASEQQMAALRVYRMIEDRQNRNPEWVEQWMARQWQLQFPGEGQVQRALMRHLKYALAYADADLGGHRRSVDEIQQALRKVPLSQRLYAHLKHEAERDLRAGLDLRQQVGPAFDVIYQPTQNQRLPALLTAKGFNAVFEPRSQRLTQMALFDQWALGERQELDYSPTDRAVLAGQIRNLYSADYIDSWQQSLNRLTVTSFHDLAHAVSVLAQLTGPAAPLRRLLETVRDNTVFDNIPAHGQEMDGLGAVLDSPSVPGKHSQTLDIGRAFTGLNGMLEVTRDRRSYYEETLDAIKAVHDYARAVQDSPDRGKAALDAVLGRFSTKGGDPIATLLRIAAGLPDPLRQQVVTISEQTAQVLVVEALYELERRWHAEVYSFFEQRLAARYPFISGAPDAALEDFEAFFGPKGRLQQFQERYLDVLLKENLNAPYAESLGGDLIRMDVMQQLEAATRIRETFFDNRGNLGVQFSIEPLGLGPKQRAGLLDLEGQMIAYPQGGRTVAGIIWPNPRQARSTLTLLREDGHSSSLEYRGPWSMFRLLSRGMLNGRSETSVDLTFKTARGVARYKLSSEKAFNPITQQPFKDFSLPRTLLETGRAGS